MKTTPWALLAGFIAAGCAALSGDDIDDGGLTARTVESAGVAASSSLEPVLAEPTVQFVDRAFASVPDAAPESADGASPCGREAVASVVGLHESEIDVASLPATHRFVCHGCAVTQDLQPDRLNLFQDPAGFVIRLTCG